MNDGSDACDIWVYSDIESLIITWNNKQGCFEGLPDTEDSSIYSTKYIEIIGNIHEESI